MVVLSHSGIDTIPRAVVSQLKRFTGTTEQILVIDLKSRSAFPIADSPTLRPSQRPSKERLLRAIAEATGKVSERDRLNAANEARLAGIRDAILLDALNTAQVADRLRIQPAAVTQRFRKQQLLGIKAGKQLQFPIWQFDDTTESGIVDGLTAVIVAAVAARPMELASWFIRPQPSLDDATPLQAPKSGKRDAVLGQARAVGAS